MEEKKMPNQGAYLALVILGFIFGIIWGALSLSPYKNMKAAINSGDAEAAQANAKKIRTFVIVGLILNVVFFVARVALQF